MLQLAVSGGFRRSMFRDDSLSSVAERSAMCAGC